jgi:hypothetical protein
MAAMTWGALTAAKSQNGSIQRWVNNDTVDPEEIIAEAENWLAATLRVNRGMKTRATLTLAEGDSSIDLSTTDGTTRFLDPINLHLQGFGKLSYQHEDTLDDFRAAETDGTLMTGPPTLYTIIDRTIYFDTEADTTYSMVLTFFDEPAALSASNTTNLYTTRFRALFKTVCMGFCYIFLKDENRATGLFNTALSYIAKLHETDDLVRRGQEYDVEVY